MLGLSGRETISGTAVWRESRGENDRTARAPFRYGIPRLGLSLLLGSSASNANGNLDFEVEQRCGDRGGWGTVTLDAAGDET